MCVVTMSKIHFMIIEVSKSSHKFSHNISICPSNGICFIMSGNTDDYFNGNTIACFGIQQLLLI